MFISVDRFTGAACGLAIAPCVTITGIGCGALPTAVILVLNAVPGFGNQGAFAPMIHLAAYLIVALIILALARTRRIMLKRVLLSLQMLIESAIWVHLKMDLTSKDSRSFIGGEWIFWVVAIAALVVVFWPMRPPSQEK